jgi:hypothetical protein
LCALHTLKGIDLQADQLLNYLVQRVKRRFWFRTILGGEPLRE